MSRRRLDRLTHEEARTTAAQTLEVIYSLMKNMMLMKRRLQRETSEDSEDILLHKALRREHLVVAQLRLEHGADVNSQNNKGESLLHLASLRGQLKIVRWLLENDASIDGLDNLARTPYRLS
ncbi:hypothetical protein EDB84DRAFT_1566768 [Lactarius hengduanensis]|nr:hypothetical protein EDB84DRAFT_1566768 [Lactarius hengduanensis]